MCRIQQSALESAFSGVYSLPELCVARCVCLLLCSVMYVLCYVVSVVRTCGCVCVLCACCRRGGLEEEEEDEDGDIEEERGRRATVKIQTPHRDVVVVRSQGRESTSWGPSPSSDYEGLSMDCYENRRVVATVLGAVPVTRSRCRILILEARH